MSKNDNEIDPYRMLDAFADILPIAAILPQGVREHRKGTRYSVSWRIVIALEGHELYDGKINDISLYGAAFLNGRNLKPNTRLVLHIYIPNLTNQEGARIIRVQGKTSYTVHDLKHQCFRVGIAFVEFALDSDRAYLEARLSNHHYQVST